MSTMNVIAILRDVHDALEGTADSDLDYFEDDEEEREAAPVQYAARKVMQAIQELERDIFDNGPDSDGGAA